MSNGESQGFGSVRTFDIAKGSAGEVRSMLLLTIRLNYIAEDSSHSLIEKSSSISRQLGAFAKYLRKSS